MSLYRQFNTQEEIDTEYNLSLAVPDIADWLKLYTDQSIKTRENLNCILDVPYGSSKDETVDIFPAKDPKAPLMLFIHGGYWVRCSSKDFSVLVEGFIKQGISVAVSNYSLCPNVSISDITRQHKILIAWLHNNAHQYGINTSNLFVAGHSAGGQQVAMLLEESWLKEYNLPQNIIKGGIPISGVFDLNPLIHSYLQPKLQLDQNTIDQQSPLNFIKSSLIPMLVCFGEEETTEFRRQSLEYFNAWIKCGNNAELRSEKDKHHFSIIEGMKDSNSPLCKKIVSFIQDTSSA